MTTPNVQRSSKGFSIWFEHAGVSVMFGPGNYGNHYDARFYDDGNPAPERLWSTEAEIAIRTTCPENKMITQEWDPGAFGGVLGYASPASVASAIAWALAYVPSEAADNAPALGGSRAPALSPEGQGDTP